MPLQDAVTGDGILGLKRGPLPLPVPLVTVVGAPLHLPPFEGVPARGPASSPGWPPIALAATQHECRCCCAASSHIRPLLAADPRCAAGDLRSPEGRAHVDACHATYLRALRELYDAHKDEYAPGRVKDMEFVE